MEEYGWRKVSSSWEALAKWNQCRSRKKKKKKKKATLHPFAGAWRRGWQFLDQAKRLYGAGPRPDTRATPPASPLIWIISPFFFRRLRLALLLFFFPRFPTRTPGWKTCLHSWARIDALSIQYRFGDFSLFL